MSLFLENDQVLFHSGDDSFTIPKQYTAFPYGVPRSTAQGTMNDPIFVDDDSEDDDDEVMTIEFDEENEVITMSRKKDTPASFPMIHEYRQCESDDETITIDFDEDNEMITLSRRKEGRTIQPTTTSFPIQKRKRYESDEEVESNYDRTGKKTKIASFFNDSEWWDDSRSDFEELYTPPACVRREYHDEELNWNWNASVVDEEGYDSESDGEMDSESAYYLSSMFDEEFNQWFQSVVGVYDSDSDDDDSSSNYDSDSDSADSCQCSRYYDSDSCELDSNDWDTGSGYETPL